MRLNQDEEGINKHGTNKKYVQNLALENSSDQLKDLNINIIATSPRRTGCEYGAYIWPSAFAMISHLRR
jgi:hypothetical protein